MIPLAVRSFLIFSFPWCVLVGSGLAQLRNTTATVGAARAAQSRQPFELTLCELCDHAWLTAYQAQEYGRAAEISLTGYLFARSANDWNKVYRESRQLAYSWHYLGKTEAAAISYRLALTSSVPTLPVEQALEQHDPELPRRDLGNYLPSVLQNFGILLTNARRLDSAEATFRKTIWICQSERPATEVNRLRMAHARARAQIGLADILADKLNFNEAIPLYVDSKKTLEHELAAVAPLPLRSSSRAPDFIAGARADLAVVAASLGAACFEKANPDFEAADRELSEAIVLRRSLGVHVLIADAEKGLAQLRLLQNRLPEAIALAQDATALSARGTEGDNPEVQWQTALVLGQALMEDGKLTKAEDALRQSIAAIGRLDKPEQPTNRQSDFFDSLSWFFREKSAPFIALAELKIRQGSLLEALLYAELGRGYGLLHRRSTSLRDPDLKEFQAVLADVVPNQNTACIEYVFGFKDLYGFCVSRVSGLNEPSIRVVTLTRPEPNSGTDIIRQIAAFREALRKNYTPYPETVGRVLTAELLDPLLKALPSISHLLIVPDGQLWQLPFQALPFGSSEKTSYLIEHLAVSYTPSLLFQKALVSERPRDPKYRRVVSFSTLQDSDQSTPLGDVVVKSFSASAVTKKTFTEEAPDSDLLLVATHAFLSDVDPTSSYLVMSTTPQSRDPTDHLSASEIMGLNLGHGVVVLSACDTERGRFVAGEGEVGLAWAFLYAGSRSVVVSQWRIDQTATALLTQSLAKNLLLGDHSAPLTEALRSAQLELINSERYNHPFYWAGLVLVGDPGF
ncbi:MAG: CHAT domain-containing protein [Verrucomicrobia bacterium]|nr:CHAT domain-containing protein [Verrucomicrobiota bacterium]